MLAQGNHPRRHLSCTLLDKNGCWGIWWPWGVVMAGQSGSSIMERDVWKSWCWNSWNFRSLTLCLSANNVVSIENSQYRDLHLGIARKPRSTTLLRWVRWMLLWMLPMDKYTGQYSFWPVPMETVVLSLEMMIGTSMDPCVPGLTAIVSYKHQSMNVTQ